MQHTRQWWEGLGIRRRISLIVLSLGFVAALIGFLYVARTPSYIPLCANLSAAETDRILGTLREAHIPFRVEEGGSRIDVPANVHDEALVRITRLSAPQEKPFAEAKRDELQSLIDNTIGPHKAVVLVNAELSEDKEETQTSTTGVATTLTEETNGAAARRAGAASTGSLIPSTGGRYVHATAVKTSQPSHTVRHIVRGPGRIERLTVSALIDTSVPRNQVLTIKEALEAAIAANPGDPHPTRTVAVAQVPFDHSAEDSAATTALVDNILGFLRIGLPLALMVGCLLMMTRVLRQQAPFALGALRLDTDGGAHAGLPGGSGGARSGDVIDASFEADLQNLQYLSRSHPETVAMLLKSWIREEY
ncbi:MAG TPA: flagellar M-ring protein FliF C-terminal domain-containing protein [Chthonomonadaceae bacterium]|nr:flagellar M-ring protein FliF C-terminal domain-containing protein [Chthonomonadaceae bacterium]